MGHYKLIALDMDGTLLNEDKAISEGNRKAIQAAKAAGVTVVLSTGRNLHNIMAYIDELALSSPVVTVNGGEVWETPEKLQKRTTLDHRLVERMREIALRQDSWFWAYSVEGVFNKNNWIEKPISELEWLKFGYHIENPEALASIRAELESWDVLEITNSHPFNLELNPKGVSKASGLQDVCELLGIEMSQVVAVGDSLNDMSMIRQAGLGVAMGNAQEEVKREAGFITSSNEEDGVARVIWEHLVSPEGA
ncbi:Cof-type HAD-IIB family hydrolase [Paenibacillus thalictri]|uniref:HAD family phosphatase n=1 Tax=Paenibacillus thalictri TaxID=2527873 RepID=A0A4Q9DK88_9BACL|nr:Cof-type HAD-IIB family hydrolase [Paenibacillus thalictri]TBL71538.1 HAD family phosphatase [Paenibacillus thalictri]